jgi:hypothetical protein
MAASLATVAKAPWPILAQRVAKWSFGTPVSARPSGMPRRLQITRYGFEAIRRLIPILALNSAWRKTRLRSKTGSIPIRIAQSRGPSGSALAADLG